MVLFFNPSPMATAPASPIWFPSKLNAHRVRLPAQGAARQCVLEPVNNAVVLQALDQRHCSCVPNLVVAQATCAKRELRGFILLPDGES